METEVRNKMDKSFNAVRQVPLTKMKVIERSKYGIRDLKKGSVILFQGNVYLITDKYKYYKKKKNILDGEEFQLTDVLTGNIRYMEYSVDDTIEIFVTEREVTAKELANIIPEMSYQFLMQTQDFHLPSDDMDYYYDDDWKSRFVKSGETLEDAELVKMVEFESDDEETYLTFEYWEDGSAEAFISYEIQSHEFEILSL